MLSPDAMAFMKHLAELYKTTGNNSFDFIEYMSVPNHSAALEELMAKGYVSWKDDFQNILGTITINLDVLTKEKFLTSIFRSKVGQRFPFSSLAEYFRSSTPSLIHFPSRNT